ncbi:MAG: hypothetical protein PHW96_02195 [Candidatus Nanoarchaeia archaeon]|nr:hypothetical protein [Candidatus Nanoarchaeia archaeon]
MKIKYPRLILLIFTFILAYLIFAERDFAPVHDIMSFLGYFGTFIAGIFYAYGFTAAPATAILLSISKGQNLLIAGLVGGLGALTGDFVIFFFIRKTFADELRRLSRTKVMRVLAKEEKKLFGKFRKYLKVVFAGFIIASPLPTEIGVAMLASIKHLSAKKFGVIAYILHTMGVFAILSIGKIV